MVKLGLFKNLEWFLTFYKGDPPSFLMGSLFGKKAQNGLSDLLTMISTRQCFSLASLNCQGIFNLQGHQW